MGAGYYAHRSQNDCFLSLPAELYREQQLSCGRGNTANFPQVAWNLRRSSPDDCSAGPTSLRRMVPRSFLVAGSKTACIGAGRIPPVRRRSALAQVLSVYPTDCDPLTIASSIKRRLHSKSTLELSRQHFLIRKVVFSRISCWISILRASARDVATLWSTPG